MILITEIEPSYMLLYFSTFFFLVFPPPVFVCDPIQYPNFFLFQVPAPLFSADTPSILISDKGNGTPPSSGMMDLEEVVVLISY